MSTSTTTTTMRAIVFDRFGGPEQFVERNLPIPEPSEGEIRIAVKAFGVNSAEAHMRAGDWGEVAHVTGIECVGLVDLDPSGTLRRGQTVAAICGGLGRTRDGSYAEYTVVPASNVFALETALGWADLAAVPESYLTAWTALFDNLHLSAGEVVFVRGATSALGQAAVNLAAGAGATVIASTRNVARRELLTSLGAKHVLIDDGELVGDVRALYPSGIEAVLEIVGTRTLRDSLQMVKKGGTVCQVGFLGGFAPLEAFDPILDLPSGVSLNFFASAFVSGSPEYPLTDVPMQRIVDDVASGRYKAKPVRVFAFSEIADAHRAMESNTAGGKIVVVL